LLWYATDEQASTYDIIITPSSLFFVISVDPTGCLFEQPTTHDCSEYKHNIQININYISRYASLWLLKSRWLSTSVKDNSFCGNTTRNSMPFYAIEHAHAPSPLLHSQCKFLFVNSKPPRLYSGCLWLQSIQSAPVVQYPSYVVGTPHTFSFCKSPTPWLIVVYVLQ
jgi:hypothetical protein